MSDKTSSQLNHHFLYVQTQKYLDNYQHFLLIHLFNV